MRSYSVIPCGVEPGTVQRIPPPGRLRGPENRKYGEESQSLIGNTGWHLGKAAPVDRLARASIALAIRPVNQLPGQRSTGIPPDARRGHFEAFPFPEQPLSGWASVHISLIHEQNPCHAFSSLLPHLFDAIPTIEPCSCTRTAWCRWFRLCALNPR
jgi:hypothetical protein